MTGNILPDLSWVRALNCLQKSIMFTPFEPSAGPTGGEGLAAPPLICNLMRAAISLAIMIIYLFFNYLNKIQLQECFPSKNFNHYLELLLVFKNLLNRSIKTVERTIDYLYRLTDDKWCNVLLLHISQLINTAKDPVHLRLAEWYRLFVFTRFFCEKT